MAEEFIGTRGKPTAKREQYCIALYMYQHTAIPID